LGFCLLLSDEKQQGSTTPVNVGRFNLTNSVTVDISDRPVRLHASNAISADIPHRAIRLKVTDTIAVRISDSPVMFHITDAITADIPHRPIRFNFTDSVTVNIPNNAHHCHLPTAISIPSRWLGGSLPIETLGIFRFVSIPSRRVGDNDKAAL
jgi:hypothetical protein